MRKLRFISAALLFSVLAATLLSGCYARSGYYGGYYYTRPARVYYTRPVYVAPPPTVYVAPRPVYVAPQPTVYVAPRPVYVAPPAPPAVGIRGSVYVGP
jgi:hypothetical protein